jgi:hypothetical protein
MASLRSLLGTKSNEFVSVEEQNLEKGRIYVYTPGTVFGTSIWCGWCFHPEVSGVATIEMWGAGGSGAEMCCCGFGLPGNSGAYYKKTISMSPGDYVCGYPGFSCGNADDLCFRGCSDASQMIYCVGGQCICACARGGKGGLTICSTDPSYYCCYRANGFCVTKTFNENCGIVCNQCSGAWCAISYGGDVNCCGRPSCVSAFGCYPSCICLFIGHIPTPAGMFAREGNMIVYTTENDNDFAQWSGSGHHQALATLGAGRWPTGGTPFATCWGASKACGCYQEDGCNPVMPIGTGGRGPNPCPGVRDHAIRGGHGGVRIKFVS